MALVYTRRNKVENFRGQWEDRSCKLFLVESVLVIVECEVQQLYASFAVNVDGNVAGPVDSPIRITNGDTVVPG
jgi:hypothetical protein